MNITTENTFETALVQSLVEQQSIVRHIESECKLIDLLNEYREALISEVVTGKVKVI